MGRFELTGADDANVVIVAADGSYVDGIAL